MKNHNIAFILTIMLLFAGFVILPGCSNYYEITNSGEDYRTIQMKKGVALFSFEYSNFWQFDNDSSVEEYSTSIGLLAPIKNVTASIHISVFDAKHYRGDSGTSDAKSDLEKLLNQWSKYINIIDRSRSASELLIQIRVGNKLQVLVSGVG